MLSFFYFDNTNKAITKEILFAKALLPFLREEDNRDHKQNDDDIFYSVFHKCLFINCLLYAKHSLFRGKILRLVYQ